MLVEDIPMVSSFKRRWARGGSRDLVAKPSKATPKATPQNSLFANLSVRKIPKQVIASHD